MTTQTEALKLALEALENLINQHYAETTTNDDLERAERAITAIKEALAQPELCKYGQEPKSCTSSPMDCQCVIDAALAQPEQKPVAWLDVEGNGIPVPVYTIPPQRTWVGLTDAERKQLWDDWENGHVVEATEAKLKEKNT